MKHSCFYPFDDEINAFNVDENSIVTVGKFYSLDQNDLYIICVIHYWENKHKMTSIYYYSKKILNIDKLTAIK